MSDSVIVQGAAKSAGDSIEAGVGAWSFAGNAAKNFEAHVSKSVPLYEEGHALICSLSEFFLGESSLVYEIGCSTALLSRKIADHHASHAIRIVGLDVEADMIEEAGKRCAGYPNIELHAADACHVDFEKADLIVAYYTVQFVPPKMRQKLLDKLYEALNWGGALIMFEKVRAPDARFQDIASQTYLDYKLNIGYMPDEIIGKARSLKRVLEPFSSQANMDLMARSGFKDITSVMKYVCFEGFMAIK